MVSGTACENKGELEMEWRKEANRIFAVNEAGVVVAEITFPETKEGVCTIDHTEVDDSLRGQGIAGKLVEAAVSEIEAQGKKAEATCSYAKRWLEKHAK